MLKLFRKKLVSKIILWGLLILILPAFVMWGNASMSRSKEKGPDCVGVINNKKVSFEEFYGALGGVRSQVILNYFNQPKVLDAILGNKPLTAKIAWDRLIMLDEAKKLKIKITDKELIQFIQTHPLFSRNGGFDDKFYDYILRTSMNLEPRAFEEMARDNLAIQKLVHIIVGDIKVADKEVADEYQKEFSKIKISYLLIEPKSFLNKVKVDDAAVKDYYEKKKGDLIIKSKLKGAIPDRQATFEEAKETIENYIKQSEAGKMASQEADSIYKELAEKMEKNGELFDKAALRFGYKAAETQFFSNTDTLDILGAAGKITEAAAALKDFQISKPLEINNGFIIFEIVGRQNIDDAKFKKEKDEYAKKVQEIKSNIIMEKWLRKAEDRSRLEIKLDEVEKYYKQ
jgi:hypothetical protein